ncbi:MAG: phosphatase PAP2 family protein [Elusimicrobia bacterium]|nr:phosphatase PAP2 family protein [Elusimicrobiota bacterium]
MRRIMPSITVKLCCSALSAALLLQAGAPAFAAERPVPDPAGYGKRFWEDLKELPGKPGTWSKSQWYLAGGVLAVTGGALLVDENIRRFNEKHRSEGWRNLSFASTHFGDVTYQVPIISGFYLGGLAFGSMTMRKIAADATEASIIAAFLINPALCFITGRALPKAHEEPGKFVPFRLHRFSFPSGHTSAAFALASVLDVDLRSAFGYWQTPLLYGIAVSVAHSRVYDDKHYLSEVILGGAIGWSIGTWIASKDRGGRSVPQRALTLEPTVNGAQLALRF